jgi:uncharacterized protein
MWNAVKIAAAAALSLGVLLDTAALAQTPKPPQRSTAQQPEPAKPKLAKAHRIVIQISQNDPAVMNVALNNAENLAKHYSDKGEKVDIEFVAYGPGLHMMRSDTSPVKDRLATMSLRMNNVIFSACGNTLAGQSRQENKEITLLPEARLVQTGIARILELQEQGWSYVRP